MAERAASSRNPSHDGDHAVRWLDATWDDVQIGTPVRRDIGDVAEVRRKERLSHRHGYRLAVELLCDDGRWLQLTVEPTNFVQIGVRL